MKRSGALSIKGNMRESSRWWLATAKSSISKLTVIAISNFITKLGKLPLKHQPGDAWTYGVNQDVLGALIERISGKTFGAFLEERLFRPLGMKDTGFDVPEEKMNRLAKTYKHGPDGKFL